jgi:hypothetical protein
LTLLSFLPYDKKEVILILIDRSADSVFVFQYVRGKIISKLFPIQVYAEEFLNGADSSGGRQFDVWSPGQGQNRRAV